MRASTTLLQVCLHLVPVVCFFFCVWGVSGKVSCKKLQAHKASKKSSTKRTLNVRNNVEVFISFIMKDGTFHLPSPPGGTTTHVWYSFVCVCIILL